MNPDREASTREQKFFATLRRDCLADDPKAARDNLVAWLGALYAAGQSDTTKELAIHLGDADLAEEIKRLHDSLNSAPLVWSGTALLDALNRARLRYLDVASLSQSHES